MFPGRDDVKKIPKENKGWTYAAYLPSRARVNIEWVGSRLEIQSNISVRRKVTSHGL